MMKRNRRLFVLVHGNHGAPEDMRPIESILKEKLPNSVFLMSSANTHCGIDIGGKQLAEEIISELGNDA